MTTTDPAPPAAAGAVRGVPIAGASSSGAFPVPGTREAVVVAAIALAVLAGSSTGSLVIAAVLVGIATADRWRGAAVLLACLAVSLRFGTTTFDDVAGIQSVLGPAVVVGPPVAAASAWCAGAAVLLAARVPPVLAGEALPLRWCGPVAIGLFSAALVAGPGPDDLWMRVGASAVAVVAAVGLCVLDDRLRWLRLRWIPALAAGAAACALAAWPA